MGIRLTNNSYILSFSMRTQVSVELAVVNTKPPSSYSSLQTFRCARSRERSKSQQTCLWSWLTARLPSRKRTCDFSYRRRKHQARYCVLHQLLFYLVVATLWSFANGNDLRKFLMFEMRNACVQFQPSD